MEGGADQRFHVGRIGRAGGGGWGGNRVQRISIQSCFCLSDSSEETGWWDFISFGWDAEWKSKCGAFATILPSWWGFFGWCFAGVIRARWSRLNNSEPPAAPLPLYTDLVYIRSFQVGRGGLPPRRPADWASTQPRSCEISFRWRRK